MSVSTTEVRSRGLITIPKSIREANNIQDGQQYTIHDLGQGMLLFSPRVSQVDALCSDLRDTLIRRGATLEEMLADLRRIREAGDA